MRFNLVTIAASGLLLALSLSASLAFSEGTTDPEAQANQNLGSHAATTGSAATASQPPTNDPLYEPPRATPVAKDLEADDVVVEEIHTQGTPPGGKAKTKTQLRPSEDDSGDNGARDTNTEARGSEQIAPHESASPSQTNDTAQDNADAADHMQMKMRPVKEASADVEPTPTPAAKQKPKRVQKGAAVASATAKSTKKSGQKSAKTTTKASAKAEKVAVETAPSAETVLKWLANGNTRFVKKNLRADGKSPADRARLVGGEHPHAAILAAADSRVVPEIIFDQALGEVYDVRAFGENLDSATVAALEYAVAKLKVPVIVVMGNSDCSAVKTMIEDKINENGDHVGDGITSPDIEKVISDIKPRLKTLKDDPVSPAYEVEATLNADGIARELVKRSDIIREAVERNGLVIKSALYRLDTGKVSFY